MSSINGMSDIPYLYKEDKVDPYKEAFDINNNNIDFDVLNTYKNSEYVFNQNNLDDVKNRIDNMQENWDNDVDSNLANKYDTLQEWIDNLDSEVVPWGTDWQSEVEKDVYLYRPCPQLNHDYNHERNKVVGGTLVWNQLVQNGNFTSLDNWTRNSLSNYSVSNNVYHFTINNDEGGISQYISFVRGHKYFITAEVKSTNAALIDNAAFIIAFNNSEIGYTKYTGEWRTCTGIYNCNDTGLVNVQLIDYRNSTIAPPEDISVRNVMIVDITQMFNSDIAQYVYTLEMNTEPGEDVFIGDGAKWMQQFVNTFFPYSNGSLQSVNVSAHVMRDANDVIIGNYPLDSDLELRGMPKLDANNNLYYDGDVYEPSGSVTRKYGIVDLGTMNWSYDASYTRMFAVLPTLKNTGARLLSFVCAKYINIDDGRGVADVPDKSVYNGNSGTDAAVFVKDTSYTDAASFKTAMSGVYLVYPLATETTETADPFTAIQTVDPYGTEEYVDYGVSQGTRSVSIPAGSETIYLQTPESGPAHYSKNNRVYSIDDPGALFLCLNDCDGSIPLPTEDSPINNYWVRLYPVGYNSYNLTPDIWSPGTNYSANTIVWVEEGDINFYVCIQDASTTGISSPADDPTHWVKLFTIPRDKFTIYDSMPDQTFFNNELSPSVFGVVQSDGTSIKIVDRRHSESLSNPTYLNLKQNSNSIMMPYTNNNIYTSMQTLLDNNNIGNTYMGV